MNKCVNNGSKNATNDQQQNVINQNAQNAENQPAAHDYNTPVSDFSELAQRGWKTRSAEELDLTDGATEVYYKSRPELEMISNAGTLYTRYSCGKKIFKYVTKNLQIDADDIISFKDFIDIQNVHVSQTGRKSELKLFADAFNGCVSLESLNVEDHDGNPIPIRTDSISNGVFKDCYMLRNINIDMSRVKNIGDSAFGGCTSFGGVDMTTAPALQKIGHEAFIGSAIGETTDGALDFSNCGQLSDIKQSAFAACNNIKSVRFHVKRGLRPVLKTVGNYTFANCENLLDADFSDCRLLEDLGRNALSGCVRLKNVSFADCAALKKIGKETFSSCRSLEKVDFSDSAKITDIGEDAFFGCKSLTELINIDLSGLMCIRKNTFKGCASLRIDLGAARGIERIGENAFDGCASLGAQDFSGCGSIRYIGKFAFRGCTAMDSVNFEPNGGRSALKGIMDNAFEGCTGMKTANFKNCRDLESIGENAFLNCTGLERVSFENCGNLHVIFENAFAGCENLREINFFGERGIRTDEHGNIDGIDATEIHIGRGAFAGCRNLEQIDLSQLGEVKIANGAFAGCGKLRKIVLPKDYFTRMESYMVAQSDKMKTRIMLNEIRSIFNLREDERIDIKAVGRGKNLEITIPGREPQREADNEPQREAVDINEIAQQGNGRNRAQARGQNARGAQNGAQAQQGQAQLQ